MERKDIYGRYVEHGEMQRESVDLNGTVVEIKILAVVGMKHMDVDKDRKGYGRQLGGGGSVGAIFI